MSEEQRPRPLLEPQKRCQLCSRRWRKGDDMYRCMPCSRWVCSKCWQGEECQSCESRPTLDLATLCFIVLDGRVLLIRKLTGLGAGKIVGPGGKLEPGETHRMCVHREMQEELSVRPVDLSERGQLLFQWESGYSMQVRVFITRRGYLGRPKASDEAEPIWYPLDSIPYAEMWPDDRLWLPILLEGGSFEGRFLYDGEDMVDWRLTAAPTPARLRAVAP